MRYRILTITYHDGKQNYFPQKLTITGYKPFKMANGGDRVSKSIPEAEEFIRKIKAKKRHKKYIW